jgi:hypothetical protein
MADGSASAVIPGICCEEATMPAIMAILDGYTVEPSGLGVPPYLSIYVRDAYSWCT